MSDLGDNGKYKWTSEATTLLVSVWTDRQVQQQLENSKKPQLIWESISKYMQKKGYEVTAKQCRSRMKQVLVCYKEAKKTGTHAGVERYYESIDKVLESKRMEKIQFYDKGIDTVDSVPILPKSPLKEAKTNENLRMRQNKLEEMPISLNRHIEVFPGVWQTDRDEYVDSSESNETVLVRPHRSLSPMRNIGTNTVSETMRLHGKPVRRSLNSDDRCYHENIENNRFAEIPLQSGVQNVHNQIIQENMMLRNQLGFDNIGPRRRPTDYPSGMNNPCPRVNFYPENTVFHPNRIATNMVRMQSQLQQYSLDRNMAMSSKPRKSMNVRENAAMNDENKQYQRAHTETYSPDIAPNLNDAFSQGSKNMKIHNLNETYDRQMFIDDENPCPIDATTITNNATFNDDTLSIEFVDDSPSPTENGAMETTTNSLYNRVTSPNPPFRKKKAQKLEQMMLNAITSQTEVFNKILATQDVMISRILDVDKEHQNRLENRLDQLMNVVQATVVDKNQGNRESNNEPRISPTPLQNVPLCFSPPPKPGTAPPKLDLVPPKPCRVPCTNPSTNIEFTRNSLPVQTGAVTTKPGTIWTKLGPVSQSPFMKAQRQITAVTKAAEHWRTRSSAERRIAYAPDTITDPKTIIEETEKFLQSEKLMEARIENARRLLSVPERDQHARRKLFEPEPLPQNIKPHVPNKQKSDAGLLCAAFLDIERKSEDKLRSPTFYSNNNRMNNCDDLLTGQGESYDRLRRLSVGLQLGNNIDNVTRGNDMNTSTPAKPDREKARNVGDYETEPRQTIQQLAELVMNSARWRNDAAVSAKEQLKPPNQLPLNDGNMIPTRPLRQTEAQQLSRNKALDWLQNPYSYNMVMPVYEDSVNKPKNYPMGFIMPNNNVPHDNVNKQTVDCPIGFNPNFRQQYEYQGDVKLQNEEGRRYQYDLRNEKRAPAMPYDSDGESAPHRRKRGIGDKAGDDIDDEEFLDTTTTLRSHRKPSLTSTGTGNNPKFGASSCILS